MEPVLDVSAFEVFQCIELYSQIDYCQAFIQATEYISQGTVSLVFQVIPLIDKIHEVLEDTQDDKFKHTLVRHAAGCSIGLLNKYYELTDGSDIYRVAMRVF